MTNYAKVMEYLLENGQNAEELNAANHLALEQGRITMKEFQEAAWVLAQTILKR